MQVITVLINQRQQLAAALACKPPMGFDPWPYVYETPAIVLLYCGLSDWGCLHPDTAYQGIYPRARIFKNYLHCHIEYFS
jgi:hypothetical protein